MKPLDPKILMDIQTRKAAGGTTTPLEILKMKQQRRPSTALSAVDQFLGKPGGAFLMNLLAQSGYSTMPDSPLGAVGRAQIGAQQQMQQNRLLNMDERQLDLRQQEIGQRGELNDVQRRLLESRIGLNRAKADPANQNPSAGNVASTFEGENGNVWVFQRGNTQPQDTGVPFRKSRRFQENPDGSITLYGEDGQVLKTVRSSETARDQALAGVETELATEGARTANQDIRLRPFKSWLVTMPSTLDI
ncbi:MAG: hypothetical protein AAF662_06565 [Pseudomonadota bacterium]